MTPKTLAEEGRRLLELGVTGATGTMLAHWAREMIQSVDRYSVDPVDMLALSDARADNARLRGLIVKAEHCGGDPGDRQAMLTVCPWCRDEPHAADCPAFAAPGVVR